MLAKNFSSSAEVSSDVSVARDPRSTKGSWESIRQNGGFPSDGEKTISGSVLTNFFGSAISEIQISIGPTELKHKERFSLISAEKKQNNCAKCVPQKGSEMKRVH